MSGTKHLFALTTSLCLFCSVAARAASENEELELVRMLAENKLEVLRMIGNVGMLWWVSAVVFCGTIVGVAWYYRDQILTLQEARIRALFIVVSLFFVSIVVYGIWTVYGVYLLESDFQLLMSAHGANPVWDQRSEFVFVRVAYSIGTTSFIIVTFLWMGLYFLIMQQKRRTEI